MDHDAPTPDGAAQRGPKKRVRVPPAKAPPAPSSQGSFPPAEYAPYLTETMVGKFVDAHCLRITAPDEIAKIEAQGKAAEATARANATSKQSARDDKKAETENIIALQRANMEKRLQNSAMVMSWLFVVAIVCRLYSVTLEDAKTFYDFLRSFDKVDIQLSTLLVTFISAAFFAGHKIRASKNKEAKNHAATETDNRGTLPSGKIWHRIKQAFFSLFF